MREGIKVWVNTRTAWTRIAGFMSHVKVLVTFYQVATILDVVYLVQFPYAVQSVLKSISLVITLDLIKVGLPSIDFGCLAISGYLSRILSLTFAAPVLSILVALAYFMHTRYQQCPRGHDQKGQGERVNKVADKDLQAPSACCITVGNRLLDDVLARKGNDQPEVRSSTGGMADAHRRCCSFLALIHTLVVDVLHIILRIIYLAYPSVLVYAFRAFSCEEFEDGPWLRADYAIRCWEDEHWSIVNVAIVTIAAYPIGVPALYATMLWSIRGELKLDAPGHQVHPSKLCTALAFIHQEYTPSCFMWEVVEVMRRVLLCGVAVWISPGSITQLLFAAMVSLIYMAVITYARPYKDPYVQCMASITAFCQAALFVEGIVLKSGMLTDLDAINDQLSAPVRKSFHVDSALLTLFLLGTTVGTMVVMICILCVQLREEHSAHVRQQSRLSARRLKLYIRAHSTAHGCAASSLRSALASMGGTLIHAPSTKVKYHLFLSHGWQHAQDQMRAVKTSLQEILPDLDIFLDVDDMLSGLGAEQVQDSDNILLFVTSDYFMKPNCMRELLHAIFLGKPLITMLEMNRNHGGISRSGVLEQLRTNDTERRYHNSWNGAFLIDEVEQWLNKEPPEGSAKGRQFCMDFVAGRSVADALITIIYDNPLFPPVEYNRIARLQDVSLKMLIDCILPADHEPTYFDDELRDRQRLALPELTSGGPHIYCSPFNPPGAHELLYDLNSRPVLAVALILNLRYVRCP